MLLTYLLFNAGYGAIVSIVWAFAANYQIKTGLIYGSIVGALFGIILYIIARIGSPKNTELERRTNRGFGTVSSMLMLLGIISGFIWWAVRAIFF